MNFRFMIPLRLHTDFSLLKAMVSVEKYVTALKARGYAGGAITDFDNAFGWVDFYFQMKKAGLKAVLGTTLSLALDGQTSDRQKSKGNVSFLVLNAEGYQNLCLLLSSYSLQNLTIEKWKERSAGLVMLVSPDHPNLSVDVSPLLEIWPKENLFFEIHRVENGPDEEAAVAAAKKWGAQCVATQPVYFLDPEDWNAHEVMLSIGASTTIADENRPKLVSRDFNLKTREQMEGIFRDRPEWLRASEDILARVKFEWKSDDYHIPKYEDLKKSGFKKIDDLLDEECRKGLEARLELVKTYTPAEKFPALKKVYEDRLKEECEIIHRMRFSDYFLVVADFIRWSKSHDIPVGPGRGSGAGSLAAYCLSIVDIDPVRYTLLFERFLNPERVSMPDFDVDFCIKGRDQVIRYVREKYNLTAQESGKEAIEENLKVAQIITFGKMKSKAVIRDVGRALGIPYQDVDAIAKLIPNILNITLADAYEKEPEFANLRARDPKADELLKIADRLEGLNRHASVHAAGVVIADDILTKYIPLYRGSDQEIVSQFEMKGVEKLGLLKFDFLGLRNLTVIQECIRLTGQEIDLLKINYDDPKVMGELSLGDTVGIFQLESSGMRDVIRRLKPTCLEDIIAIVALYRPGPLEGGMVDDFILRKAGRTPVVYDSPVLEPILKETYGVFVYQEQVMKTANVMAGFSLGEADLLRRAMGKKIASEMAQQREKFVEGAKKLGQSEHLAQKIFDLMSEFAKYGFNKSHAAAYAMITVQTAYLKTYFPEAFFAALLSSESEDIDKLGYIIRAATAGGIEVLSPHVNFSHTDFALEESEDRKKIRYGLSAIKNLGDNVSEAIVKEREENGKFKSFENFFSRAPIQILNKRQAECLIRSGALDGLGATRASLFASLDSLMGNAAADGQAKLVGQKALFASKPKMKIVEEWADRIRLNDEKHLLGTYMTGHPLKAFQALLQSFKTRSIQDLHEKAAPSKDSEISVAGLVISVKEIFTKKGTKMAFFTLEDREASIEVVMFSDLFERKGNLLAKERVLLVKAQVSREGDMTKLLARDISDLSQVQFSELHIRLAQKSHVDRLELFSERVRKYPGAIKVKVHIPVDAAVEGKELRESHVTVETNFEVSTHPELMNWLSSEFGETSLSLH
ncbi:MAG: DNA polymerase III subunit alpha [Deltaproteobacteria bacterium]|nr:DNA polymerase III subunit alpha [Deltaproteobacteria bacterium]